MIIKNYRNLFLFGLLAGLSFPPIYFLIFLPISFFYLINTIVNLNNKNNEKKILKSFLYGFVFGFGYYLTQLYWISFSLFVDIKTYFWLFPFAVVGVPIICSFYFAFAILFFFYTIQKFNIKNKFFTSVLFSFFYVLFEYIRGFIFPWNLISYTLGFSDIFIQIVRYLNIYLFDFILVIFFCFTYTLFEYKNKKIIFIKENYFYIIFYIFIFLFLFLFGIIRLSNAKTKNFNLNFRLVQANIPQTLKWNRMEMDNNINKYIDLTTSNGYDNVDIIIWSETSIPYLLTKDSKLGEKFNKLKNKILITGALRGEIDDNEIKNLWNSIFVFENNEVVDYYDKNILVPFGEYIPFSNYIPFIKKITEGNIDFSIGNGNKTINIKGIKISPLVCYEIIFPNKIIDNSNPPDLIINLTNDSWFGISSGPYQHFVATKFRAIENAIPIIRVANSGITAYIDEYGRVVKKTKLNTLNNLDLIF